jgi:hypothetical protein
MSSLSPTPSTIERYSRAPARVDFSPPVGQDKVEFGPTNHSQHDQTACRLSTIRPLGRRNNIVIASDQISRSPEPFDMPTVSFDKFMTNSWHTQDRLREGVPISPRSPVLL